MATVAHMQWNEALVDQLDWHWQHQLRPGFDGLTDEEYLWEPVPGCWNIRPVGASSTPDAVGSGAYRLDHAYPPPDPPPVTTIAWRLGHIITGVLGQRAASHFGGPAVDLETFPYAGTAGQALHQLDDAYRYWTEGVRALGEEGLNRPCGPAEGPFAEYPLATLVLHINRETIHHGAEISLLRDLFRHRVER
jgi:hypothetical protein